MAAASPLPARTPEEQVAHLVRLWRRGIICPGELWNQIHDLFGEGGVAAGLDGSSAATQTLVREIFAEMLWTADLQPSESIARREIRQWCEDQG